MDNKAKSVSITGTGIETEFEVPVKAFGSASVLTACDVCENTGCFNCNWTGWVEKPWIEDDDGMLREE